MTNDMTTGSPVKLILTFSLPLLIGNIFQQLYSMADTIIVGRTISMQALAAVGATGAISFLVLGFVQGLASGFSVVTAQRFGAGDEDGVRRSVAISIVLSLIAMVIITIISVATARPLLELMNTPSDIIDDSYKYIVVIYWGIGASIFYNLLSSILRALGDSKTPLLFLIIASIVNIVLDFVFILVFHMGVDGAGWATVIAQLFSGVLCLFYMKKHYVILWLSKEDFKMDKEFVLQHLKIALPMAFQFSITAVGIMVMQSVLNKEGSDTVAAFTAASKIENLVTQPFVSLGVAMATYTAQNYGAKKLERIRDGVRKSVIIALALSIIGGVIVIFFGRPLVSLFIENGTQKVFDQAQTYLNVIAVFFIMLAVLLILRNVLMGLGKGTSPMMGGVIELGVRIVASPVLAAFTGYVGICMVNPLAWIGAVVLLVSAYFLSIRKIVRTHELD